MCVCVCVVCMWRWDDVELWANINFIACGFKLHSNELCWDFSEKWLNFAYQCTHVCKTHFHMWIICNNDDFFMYVTMIILCSLSPFNSSHSAHSLALTQWLTALYECICLISSPLPHSIYIFHLSTTAAADVRIFHELTQTTMAADMYKLSSFNPWKLQSNKDKN
jgi:hypothetical protein